MSILNKLTEGIVDRDLGKEGAALLTKWERTGLLEGLDSDHTRSTMARLLENQAKELLREASTMAGGDVEGFAAVAFPIVRRVFGSLIANDLVSVQPMSLPSGLIFFMDFQHTNARLMKAAEDSLYGGGVVGQQITGGVDLTSDNGDSGFYNLSNGYSSPTASIAAGGLTLGVAAHGMGHGVAGSETQEALPDQDTLNRLTRWDPELSGSYLFVVQITGSDDLAQLNDNNLAAIDESAAGTGYSLVRRLTSIATASGDNQTPGEAAYVLTLVLKSTGSAGDAFIDRSMKANADAGLGLTFPIDDNLNNVGERALGAVVGADTWGLENDAGIPEIDIKVDSVAITAMTKKLKAKWTPELGQDLNAYHNLDAEVELTGILSEQIALEIDREIVEDLIKGATAGTRYWSRLPGKFVARENGGPLDTSPSSLNSYPDFTGTVSEWYETLVETINDVSAQIHRKTLRGGANFLVCGPETANILEFTSGFRAAITADDDRGSVSAVKVGAVSKKWDVYVDPYFPRNVVLVGRNGSSFLESGYVYAPYVPLQTTPTIFGVEDFVPRKGVMTRYGKKMVRPDMYGLVVIEDLV